MSKVSFEPLPEVSRAGGATETVRESGAALSAPAAARYRVGDIMCFPAGEGQVLVYSRGVGDAKLMPSAAADALLGCRDFKTLDEHAADLLHGLGVGERRVEQLLSELYSSALPSTVVKLVMRFRQITKAHKRDDAHDTARALAVKEQLLKFVEDGLLVSDDVTRYFPPGVGAGARAKGIATVAAVTRDRPESLRRCLVSYIENCRRHGRASDFVVADDASSAEGREATRRTLRSLKEEYGVAIYYAGLEEKRAFAEALARGGDVPAEVVEFALFDLEGTGCSIGANRNALLLHTAGDMFLSVDDDTVCQLASAPAASERVALSSEVDPTKFWFYQDREEAIGAATFVDRDVLQLHEQMLGRSLGECVGLGGEAAAVEHAGQRLLRRVECDERRLRVTFTGVLGDSGMYSTRGYLLMNADSRERLLRTEAAYRQACTSREVLRAVDRPTITDSIWFVSTALGIDNTDLLPPFLPVQRNEDGTFGLTLRKCFEHGYVGHLPWAVIHAPVESRPLTRDDMWKCALNCRLADVVTACLNSVDFWPGMTGPRERLRLMGTHLVEVGSMTPKSFEEFVRVQWWAIQSSYISMLEGHLQSCGGQPDYWAEDLRTFVRTLRERLTEKDYFTPVDLLARFTPEEALAVTRRVVFNFGRLLQHWPEMVSQAERLRARGVRLGTPV